MSTAYPVAVWVAAHTEVLALIANPAGTPVLQVQTSSGTVLAEVELDKAAAAVETNGDLTLPILAQEASTSAGVAAKAVVKGGTGAVALQVPCVQGSSPVAGSLAINSLVFEAGQSFELTAAVIKAGATV